MMGQLHFLMSSRADMREVRLSCICLCPRACECLSVCTCVFTWICLDDKDHYYYFSMSVVESRLTKKCIPYCPAHVYSCLLSLCVSVLSFFPSSSSSSSSLFQALSVALRTQHPSHRFPNAPTHGTTALDPPLLSPHSSLPPAPFPSPV